MAAIIGLHTWGSWIGILNSRSSILATNLAQVQKFGTIAFFLISGFLFGERMDKQGPLEYYLRRLRNVFIPWLVWVSLFSAAILAKDYARGTYSSPGEEIGRLWEGILGSSFWFVPNLLLALAILLIFRRLLHDIRMGLVLLAASLFYGVNIYGHWVPVPHTHAAFGFVFYLWLGAWSAIHFQAVEDRLARIPTSALLGALFLTHVLAMMEWRILLALASAEPLNTLRITNQLYSVVATIAMVKIRRPVWPGFINVREQTFGLYLTHTFVLWGGVWALSGTIQNLQISSRFPVLSCLIVIPTVFALTYGVCLLVVKTMMAYPCLRWAVGLSAKAKGPTGRSVRAPALLPALRLHP